VADRFSLNSCLWFGQHKNKRIADVPSGYLVSLAKIKPQTRNMAGLVLFLRRYLSGPAISRQESPNMALDRLNLELSCGSPSRPVVRCNERMRDAS
jgi:hypothetical protein